MLIREALLQIDQDKDPISASKAYYLLGEAILLPG